jgi:hypothetical protein
MEAKNYITQLKQEYVGLINSEFTAFNNIAAMKNVMGVYIIYSMNGDVLYVGSTNKFHIRFGTDLKHESTHTLMKKWIRQGLFADRFLARDHLCNQCKYKIAVCNTKREAEALEHFAIWVLDPIYKK